MSGQERALIDECWVGGGVVEKVQSLTALESSSEWVQNPVNTLGLIPGVFFAQQLLIDCGCPTDGNSHFRKRTSIIKQIGSQATSSWI